MNGLHAWQSPDHVVDVVKEQQLGTVADHSWSEENKSIYPIT